MTVVGLGGAVGAVILLVAAVSLILIVVCLVRKCKKKLKNKEIRMSVTNAKAMNIEMDANLSYVPIFHQSEILTENNIAYSDVKMNQDSNNLYEIIMDPPIEDGTTPPSHNEQSGENTIEYDYVN